MKRKHFQQKTVFIRCKTKKIDKSKKKVAKKKTDKKEPK